MNLYQLHTNPESLDGYVKSQDVNPDFFWQKYGDNPEELKKREKYIARDPEYALKYAEKILKGPFPASEAEIAKVAAYSYYYARDVLDGPFPTGEEAISKDANFASYYAKRVLKADFYLDGALIAER